jgi:hypothetical protein
LFLLALGVLCIDCSRGRASLGLERIAGSAAACHGTKYAARTLIAHVGNCSSASFTSPLACGNH